MTSPSLRRRLCRDLALPSLALALAASPAAAMAAPAPATIAFNIEAGTLDAALMAYARQTGRQLIYTADLVAGRRSAGLTERLSADEALDRLLVGTDIVVRRSQPDVLVLRRRGAVEPSSQGDQTGTSGGPEMSALPSLSAQQASPAVAATLVDEVVITGSHIRGAKAGASPISIIDRDDIDRSGYATVADALNALPQNFGGAGTPNSTLVGADALGTNSAVATGLNLRGLGSDATLVLVNGRRMAGTGLRGDFADVSAIPTAAVERVEVLLDGASALYGSDAVGGVVNIILRKRFEGAEFRARVGGAAGGAQELQLAQTFGRTWGGGHALLSYEYYRRDALPYAKRDYTATADLRRFGGTDHRSYYSRPGNVLAFDPATASYRPAWAIPADQDGLGLTPGDFLAGQINLDNPNQGMDLLPRQERNSAYANLVQSLGSRVELSADLRYSRRTFAYNTAPPVATLTVTSANPYFVSPNGAASNLIAYALYDELGSSRASGSSESVGASVGLTIDMGKTWRAEVYGAFGQETNPLRFDRSVNSLILREALGSIPDNPQTAFNAAQNGYFNPYGGANPRAVLDAIGSGFSAGEIRNRVASVNAAMDGRVLRLPAGDLKLAIGAQVRRETFNQEIVSYRSTATPVARRQPTYQREVAAAFLELRAPLIGPGGDGAGPNRLEFSLAGRVERYDDVGTTANPKVGVIWSPATGLRLRSTYGRSFRAPALSEVYDAGSMGAAFLPSGSTSVLTLLRYGGNPDLEPETADSWTAGIDISPPQLPGFSLSATWFDIVFDNQIGQPVFRNLVGALTDPALAPFVALIDPSKPADLARVTALITDPTFTSPGLYPANAYGAIVDARSVNTAKAQVTGLDITAAYGFWRGEDRFDLNANLSRLFRYDRQLTPASKVDDILDTAGNPVDLRARATASWARGDFGATLGVNYVDAYRDAVGKTVESWTTTDLQVRWQAPALQGPLRGLTLIASVQNLFDVAPPFYDAPAPQNVGYDAANADPLGRVVSLQLSKRW